MREIRNRWAKSKSKPWESHESNSVSALMTRLSKPLSIYEPKNTSPPLTMSANSGDASSFPLGVFLSISSWRVMSSLEPTKICQASVQRLVNRTLLTFIFNWCCLDIHRFRLEFDCWEPACKYTSTNQQMLLCWWPGGVRTTYLQPLYYIWKKRPCASRTATKTPSRMETKD